jgi:hypothetical protein
MRSGLDSGTSVFLHVVERLDQSVQTSLELRSLVESAQQLEHLLGKLVLLGLRNASSPSASGSGSSGGSGGGGHESLADSGDIDSRSGVVRHGPLVLVKVLRGKRSSRHVVVGTRVVVVATRHSSRTGNVTLDHGDNSGQARGVSSDGDARSDDGLRGAFRDLHVGRGSAGNGHGSGDGSGTSQVLRVALALLNSAQEDLLDQANDVDHQATEFAVSDGQLGDGVGTVTNFTTAALGLL